MKKRILIVFLSVLLLAALTACGEEKIEAAHSHIWGRFYFDDFDHWRFCMVGGCEAEQREMHTTENLQCKKIPTCDICGEKYGGPSEHLYNEEHICVRCGETEYGEGLEYSRAQDSYVIAGIGTCAYSHIEISKVFNGLPVTSIGNSAFSHVDFLESIVIPDTVKSVAWGAFSGCESLKTVMLSHNLKKIPGYLFHSCTSLERMDIPSGVETISDHAFYDCKSLSEIYLPNSVKKLGGTPFMGCDSLAYIYFEGTLEEWQSVEKADDAIPETVKIVCADGCTYME